MSSAGAWNVMFKSSGITTLRYYSNQTVHPIYIPVGFTNQSIYIVNIPPSLQNSVFTLSIAPLGNGGFVANTNKTITTFVPHGNEYVLSSFFFQESGEYYISISSGQHSSFILFGRSTVPAQLYNSSASSIVVYKSNGSVSSLLRQLSNTSQNHTSDISSLNSQIKALEGHGAPASNSTLFSWVLVIFFIILLIIIFLLYKRIKSLEEVNEVKMKYGDYDDKSQQENTHSDDLGFDSKYSRSKKNDVNESNSEKDDSNYATPPKNSDIDNYSTGKSAESDISNQETKSDGEYSPDGDGDKESKHKTSGYEYKNSSLYGDKYSSYGSMDKEHDNESSQMQSDAEKSSDNIDASKDAKEPEGVSGWSFERGHAYHRNKHTKDETSEDSDPKDANLDSDPNQQEGTDDKGQYDSGITEEE